MKRLAFLALLLAFAASFAPAQESGKTYRVAVAFYGFKAEYMKLVLTAMERHPMVENGTVKLTTYDGNYDPAVQYAQIESIVNQGFDGIIFIPVDTEAGAASLELIHEHNIPVVGVNVRVENYEKLNSYVGSDDVEAGYLIAKAVCEQLGGKGNVVITMGPIGASGQIDRSEGIHKALKEYPGIKVLEEKTANWSRAESQVLMENWIVSHNGDIQGIIGQNDELAMGPIQAWKEAGLDVGKIKAAGVDGLQDALTAVRNGEMTSFLKDAVAEGQAPIDVLLRVLIGESYKPLAPCWKAGSPTYMEWGETIKPQYLIPWVPITKDNIDQIEADRLKLSKRN